MIIGHTHDLRDEFLFAEIAGETDACICYSLIPLYSPK
jgi:hypothetical protein